MAFAKSQKEGCRHMPTPVKMPRLGESVAEGTIANWLKKEGDYVEKDESLAEIVTDKINAELPSPVAGRLTRILVNADETVAVGTDIALIEESADVAAQPSEEAPSAAPGPDAAPPKSPAQAATPSWGPARPRRRESMAQAGMPGPRRSRKRSASAFRLWRGGWPASMASICMRSRVPARAGACAKRTSLRMSRSARAPPLHPLPRQPPSSAANHSLRPHLRPLLQLQPPPPARMRRSSRRRACAWLSPNIWCAASARRRMLRR